MSTIFDGSAATRPLGKLLAEGIPLASARELATKRNWRLRALIPRLRTARDQRTTVEIHCGARREHRKLYLFRRMLGRLEWALRALLEQRARVRRNRGRQLTMDFETETPIETVEQNARHSSETFEHGTPPAIVEAAHAVMGGIDLDPASCEKANHYVEAVEFFNQEDNGFRQTWHGRVFLNPPGGLMELATGRPVYIKTKKRESCSVTGACGLKPGHKHENVGSSAGAWWRKLAQEYVAWHVEQAIFIGFSLEILQTTQVDPSGLPIPLDFPICYPARRLDYIALEKAGITPGGAPTHASFIAHLPPRGVASQPDPKLIHAGKVRFREHFAPFGKVCP